MSIVTGGDASSRRASEYVDLWHFTSHMNGEHAVRLSDELEAGPSHVRPPEGSGFPGPYSGPGDPVVLWTFSDDGEPDGTVRWFGGNKTIWGNTNRDRGLVRFAVRVPRSVVRAWGDFCDLHRVDRAWRSDLEKTGEPERWAVVLRGVRRGEWLRVEARSTAESPWVEVGGWKHRLWVLASGSLPPRKLDAKQAAAVRADRKPGTAV